MEEVEAGIGVPSSNSSSVVDVKMKVIQAVAEKSVGIRQMVVDWMANDEVEARKQLVYNAIKDREKLEREIVKIKPDHETFDAEGKPTKMFSKEKFDELKKAKERLAKLDVAIDEALGTPPKYEKLKNLSGGKKQEEKPAEE